MIDATNYPPQIIDVHYGPIPTVTVPDPYQCLPRVEPPAPCWCENPLLRIIREQREEIERLKNPNRIFQS